MAQPRSRLRSLWVTPWCCILFGWSFCIGGLAMSGLAQEIVLKAWTIGPDDPSVYRATNLHTAAERLNAELVQAGALEQVKVDTDFWTGQAQQYVQRVLLAFQSGNMPDIVLNGHEYVGRYARFAPNHTAWPQYEAIVTEAIRAVQAHRLAPPAAVQFVTTRLRQQLRNQVRIVD